MQILPSAAAAAELIRSEWTVACAGFVGAGHAEAVTRALEARFISHGLPRDLTLIYGAGQGDRASRGVNHFGHVGLVRRIIGGHWISAPKLGALVNADAVEAWNLPQGVMSQWFRAVAGGKPGLVSAVGLHTFVDPRVDGGRLTPRTAASAIEPRVQLIELNGQEQLFYPSLKIDCALIRASTADARGNLSCENEPFHQDLLAIAQAARNSGGIVIAQVQRVVPAGTLEPNAVRVPGILVDHVLVTEDPDDHWMTFAEPYNPAYTAPASRRPVPAPPKQVEGAAPPPPAPLDARSIVQRRAYLELLRVQQELAAHDPPRRPVVNLGVGMPAGVAAVAAAEDAALAAARGGRAAPEPGFTLTVEAGPIGGTPADLLSFGASSYPEAIIDQAAMFDFYDGGGLDICFLGLAEFDPLGNVNVSRFGHGAHQRIAGLGGFVNISQNARRVVFMGTLRAGGLVAHGQGGRLVIEHEGARAKLLPEVGHLSFNGPYVASLGRPVRYITERAVFDLADGRLTLVEIAPGVDLERDVLARCGAPVVVASDLRLIDAAVYTPGPLRLPPHAEG
ncbi:MAG: CoA-transferase [Pseudomonadota bacterium]|jgi:propionate CoA-transferase